MKSTIREQKLNRILWIDYLKFLACIIVMLGHFFRAFYTFCDNTPNLQSYIVKMIHIFESVRLLEGNFWVCVFCVLSGYLTAQKVITETKDLFSTILLRLIHFIIPLLIVNSFVYIINKFFGFSSHEVARLYENSWLNSYFNDITKMDVIRSSFTFGAELNGPLWMLRSLILGNVVILITSFIGLKISRFAGRAVAITVAVILFFFSLKNSNVLYVFATYWGFLIYRIPKKRGGILTFSLLLLVTIFCSCLPIFYGLTWFRGASFTNTVLAILLTISFVSYEKVNKFTSVTFPIGGMSFWVYLLHWPIICSFSAYVIVASESYTKGFLGAMIFTFILVFCLAYLATTYIDRVTVLLTNTIREYLFAK